MKTDLSVFASLALSVVMMDAASGFEVEKLDAYAEQFESLSATIGDEVTKAIDSVSSFDISSLGISEKIDSVTSLLSDSALRHCGGVPAWIKLWQLLRKKSKSKLKF